MSLGDEGFQSGNGAMLREIMEERFYAWV